MQCNFNLKDRIRIELLISFILLFILRLAIPQYVKFILLSLFLVSLIYALYFFLKRYRVFGKDYFRYNTPIIVVFIFYFISFILTDDKQLQLWKDGFNVFLVLLFYIFTFVFIFNINEFSLIFKRLPRYIIIIGGFVVFFSTLKFLFQNIGIKFDFLFVEGFGYPIGTSLSVDYNFYALFCLLVLFFSFPYFFSNYSFIIRILIQIATFTLFLCIFLSVSRRGLIIEFSLFFIGIILFISSFFKQNKLINFRKNTFLIIILSIIFGFSYYYFLYEIPVSKRNQFINTSIFDYNEVKGYLDIHTYRGRTIINNNVSYKDASDRLWLSKIDPKNPYTGWANGNYIIVNPLTGNNVEIVPEGAVGASVGKNSGSRVEGSYAYYESRLFDKVIQPRRKYTVSLYCYVSPDFDGDNVRIGVLGNFKTISFLNYDLSRKGIWQKLFYNFQADSIAPIRAYLFLIKRNVKNLDSLKGHIIFSYPDVDSVRLPSDMSIVFNNFKKNDLEELNDLKVVRIEKTKIRFKVYKSSLFLFEFDEQKDQNHDSLINMTGSNFRKDMINDYFSGSRLDRWRYAVYLYRYEYKWWQKIIGGGFGYTRKFAKEFNDPDEYDYPHNPFLGVLLYSGILGLIAYIWFLYKAVFYYWIYRKEYWTLGLAFCASFFFAFFSANTPFDPAIMGILTILPYFIHYYTLKEQNAANE
ncbi:MAG: hypothetical protein AB7S48_10255 [Bacteroidales bacterium]